LTTTRARIELRDPFTRHVALVDTVAAIAPPPKAWTELRDRYDAFLDFDAAPILERLIAAVVDSGGEDVPVLKALATAENFHERSDVIIAVRGVTYPRLVQLYSEVAAANYGEVGKEFNAVASKFTTAVKGCDPEADSTEVVALPDETRSAWLDAQRLAGNLDELVPVLWAVAELCGISTAAEETALLPLVCDPAALHRRRVWECWKRGGRCGHWSTLAGLGVRIRAAELDTFEPYREPKPLIRKQFPVGGPDGKGIYKPVLLDPEDPDYTEPVEEPMRRRMQLDFSR
jgi:hypothetical protein